MEQIRRRDLEQTQCSMLSALCEYLDEQCPRSLDDAELGALGVVRWTDLDVDSPSPLDFEPRFFSPCYGANTGLEEAAKCRWRPSKDDPKKLLDPEWVRSSGYIYPSTRLKWFDRVVLRLALAHEGEETHPVNTYKGLAIEDTTFNAPFGACHDSDVWYVPDGYHVPAAADKPHMGIIMLDPTVAPEGKMLESELKAAATLLQEQVRSGQFTNHHTKPVLVFTFQWETHARLTQAHLDSKTNKLIIRQSRQFDLMTAGDRQPPPDALLLLRWLLNTPVGATRYEDEDDSIPVEGTEGGAETGGVEMPVVSSPASKVVGVKSG